MIRFLLCLVLTAGLAQAIEAPNSNVRYHPETGMYQCDLGNQALTNGQEVVLELTYPFATVTNLYLQLDGQVKLIPTSGTNQTADAIAPLTAPGGWLSGTTGLKSPSIKLRAQGTVRLKSITADCGRSQRVLQLRALSPLQPVLDEIGSVRYQSEDPVELHPRDAYYAIAAPHLSAAQMHRYSDLNNTTNRFETTFFVSNPNQRTVTGRLEITLPTWANTANTRVYFHTVGDSIFGISQPPDSLQFNDETPLVPETSGWANTPYRKMATNDTMTITWNQFRHHARETRDFSLHNTVSFKGRARYDYLRQDGSWAVLNQSPWMTCPIPADASRSPFQLRVTCLGDVDRGNFSANGNLLIPRTLLVEDDYFLPIDDGDGRGNPLGGWNVDGIDTQSAQNILGVSFRLDANPNPLQLKARGTSSLTGPGPQVLVKVEVTR